MGFPICNRSFLEHTTMPPRGVSWPPADSAAFIRTDVFANLMISIITDLAEKYPHMDFADAAASLFTWLDRKVATEPGFISGSSAVFVGGVSRVRGATVGFFEAWLGRSMDGRMKAALGA